MKNENSSHWRLSIDSDDGQFVATYSDQGLRSLDFPKTTAVVNGPAEVPESVAEWHKLTINALALALKGKRIPALPPLDLKGTAFQQEVWRALAQIESGRTASYSEIARRIGRPRAVRAVGGACGANPVPVLVPCHRVLASGNRIGGFSGGLEWKKLLLSREGIRAPAFENLQFA